MTEPVQWGVYRTPIKMRAKGGQKGEHYVIVVQSAETVPLYADVQVVPLSSKWGGSKRLVRCVAQTRNPYLDHDSWALVHLVGPIEKTALHRLEHAGQLHPTDSAQVQATLRLLFDLL